MFKFNLLLKKLVKLSTIMSSIEIAKLTKGLQGLFVTAPGYDEYDYVCRVFIPNAGIPEVYKYTLFIIY